VSVASAVLPPVFVTQYTGGRYRIRGNYTGEHGASRVLIALGVVLIAAGVLVRFAGRLPFKLGRLPGDILIQGKHSSFYFPLTTCILLSVALSLLLWALRR